MDFQTMALLHEYLNYELRKVQENLGTNLMNRNLKLFGSRLGEKLMLRLAAQAPTARTKDPLAALKFFLEQFWEAAFGKKIDRASLPDSHKITFADPDFDFVTRASSKSSDAKAYQEHCKNLVRYMIEGALGALFLKCSVDINIEGKATLFTIECAESV